MSTININLSANTIYSGDGTLAGNRTVDANGYQLQISNAGVFIVDGSFAPSGVNGTFTLNGYGTLSTDRVERITSGSGVIRETFGNKQTVLYGKTSIGSDIGSGYLLEVDGLGLGMSGIVAQSSGSIAIQGYDATNIGVYGGTQSGIGVYGIAGTSGKGGFFKSDTGLASLHIGRVVIEPTESGVYSPSAMFEVRSTEKGFLTPRLTITERDAISSPAVGLEIYNTTLGRKEVYNSTFGWVTVAQRTIHVECNTIATLSTGSNFYFANFPLTASTTLANREFLSPYTGKITGAFIRSFANSVAGNRDISVYLVINGTDYLIATVTGSTSTANREFINEAINTTGVPVIKNVTKIAIKAVAGTGTTDSTNILFGGTLIVQ